jgi:hypothetical protein
MVCFRGIENKENYQDSLANTAKRCKRESETTCSAARTTMGISLFVDKDWVRWVFPQRKFSRKPCTSTSVHPPVSSLTFGRDFNPTDVVSKSCRPQSRGCCPQNLGDRTFCEPFWPKLVVAQGQGRVDCRGRVPGEHPNRFTLKAKKTEAESARCRADSFTPGPPFPVHSCIHDERKQRRELLLKNRPEQEDTRSSPSSLMELKFELDTRLTVSCVVAVALVYGLVTVLIVINSVLLALGNAVIILLILFILFGWRELLGEFGKKRSAAK